MSSLGLSVSRVVNVSVNLAPVAVPTRNFGAMMVLGDSDVIDVTERIREYNEITDVAADFGTSAPEYKAALLHFSQNPQPDLLYIARWGRAAVAGRLNGKTLSSAEQDISLFTAVTTGAMQITIDGTNRSLTAMDFSGQTNLNGVASVVNTKLGVNGTCVYDAVQTRFVIRSPTTGATSTVAFAVAPGSGTDVSGLLGLTSAGGGYAVTGIAAESLVTCITNLADTSNDWYGVSVASSVAPTDDAMIAAAAFIEAAAPSRILAATTQASNTLSSATTNDLASRVRDLAYTRTLVQYSSSNAYAAASILGRISTINFNGSNTTLTVKFKQEPGITAEKLTATQASVLETKKCNVFVKYENGTAILQQGVMGSGLFIDERHNIDWLADRIQNTGWNLLYTSTTKIPQTDAGHNLFIAAWENDLSQAVANGMLAPGIWNADGFGQLKRGDPLPKGWYIYAPPVATQSQADREARKSVPFQFALKLAGAIHSVDVILNVNR